MEEEGKNPDTESEEVPLMVKCRTVSKERDGPGQTRKVV